MRRSLFCLLFFAVSSGALAQKAPLVRDISRNLGSTKGGTVLTLSGSNLLPAVQCLLPCPTTVMFGDAPASLKGEVSTMLHVLTPPHAPGTVDITVSIAGAAPIVLADAFTYSTDPEADFERVLVPLYFDGVLKGAYGSEWTTSLWIRNNGADAVRIAPWSCADGQDCTSAPATYALPSSRSLRSLAPLSVASDGNPSRLLYLSQAGSADISFSVRFADQSRGLTDAGIDMPVIRENEALYGSAQLFSVPLKSSFRVLLRLYELGGVSSRFRVTIYPQSELDEQPIHSEEVTANVQAGPFQEKAGYATLDVTGLLPLEKSWPDTVRIQITPLTAGSRYWSFVSLTNNDTQIVTLVTPQ
jgi:IPT/TIG domain